MKLIAVTTLLSLLIILIVTLGDQPNGSVTARKFFAKKNKPIKSSYGKKNTKSANKSNKTNSNKPSKQVQSKRNNRNNVDILDSYQRTKDLVEEPDDTFEQERDQGDNDEDNED